MSIPCPNHYGRYFNSGLSLRLLCYYDLSDPSSLTQRTKYSDTQYTSLTPDKIPNSLVYRTLFYVNIYGKLQTLKQSGFLARPVDNANIFDSAYCVEFRRQYGTYMQQHVKQKCIFFVNCAFVSSFNFWHWISEYSYIWRKLSRPAVRNDAWRAEDCTNRLFHCGDSTLAVSVP